MLTYVPVFLIAALHSPGAKIVADAARFVRPLAHLSIAQQLPPFEPYDFKPYMTAILNAGFSTVKEEATVVVTIAMTDLDTYKGPNIPLGATMVTKPGNPTAYGYAANMNSGTGAALITVSGIDPNTGSVTAVATHTARDLPSGETSHIYADSYVIVDQTTQTLVQDPTLTIVEQVEVDKK